MAEDKGIDGCGLTGAVLAGGQSRRMGAPKEGVLLADGRPMMAHVLGTLRAVCRRVAVVGECVGFQPDPEVAHVRDLRPGAGPLAGIEALLASGLGSGYLVVACDQPLLTPHILERLLTCQGSGAGTAEPLRFFRTGEGTGLDPFPGFYPSAWLPLVRSALDRGERSVRRLIASSQVAWVTLPAQETGLLRSFNTPEELEALRQ